MTLSWKMNDTMTFLFQPDQDLHCNIPCAFGVHSYLTGAAHQRPNVLYSKAARILGISHELVWRTVSTSCCELRPETVQKSLMEMPRLSLRKFQRAETSGHQNFKRQKRWDVGYAGLYIPLSYFFSSSSTHHITSPLSKNCLCFRACVWSRFLLWKTLSKVQWPLCIQ
jgi:hypothetical protein